MKVDKNNIQVCMHIYEYIPIIMLIFNINTHNTFLVLTSVDDVIVIISIFVFVNNFWPQFITNRHQTFSQYLSISRVKTLIFLEF